MSWDMCPQVQRERMYADCFYVNPDNMAPQALLTFATRLVRAISMEHFTYPYVLKLSAQEAGPKEGHTLICPLKQSLMHLHTWPQFKLLTVDLFSCEGYDVNVILEVIEFWFKPAYMKFERIG